MDRPFVADTWLIILLLTVLLLFGILRIGFSKRTRLIFEAFLSNRFVDQLAREERSSGNPSNMLLLMIYIINLSLLIFFTFRNFSSDFDNTSSGMVFMAICGLTIAFLLFKWLVTEFMGWLFSYEEITTDLLFHRFDGRIGPGNHKLRIEATDGVVAGLEFIRAELIGFDDRADARTGQGKEQGTKPNQ